MAFPQGIDIRATAAFVTDPTNCTSEIGTTANYPRTTPQGNTVGYTTATAINTRDRNSGNDARIAGMVFDGGSAIIVYEIDLPATGSYDIFIAVGDASYARSNQKLEVFDNTTSLGVLFTGASTGAANSFLDATGVARTAANWPSLNAKVTKTFSTTKAVFKFGDGTNMTFAAHIFMQASGGATTFSPPTAAWHWNGQGPSLTFASAATKKSWVWNPQQPTLGFAVAAQQKAWRWNAQAPLLGFASAAAQKAWAWAANAPTVKFATAAAQKAWQWVAQAPSMTGGNLVTSAWHWYIGIKPKRRRSRKY